MHMPFEGECHAIRICWPHMCSGCLTLLDLWSIIPARLTAVRFSASPRPELRRPPPTGTETATVTATGSVGYDWQIFIFGLTYLSFLAVSFLFCQAFLCHVYWCVKVIKSNWTLVLVSRVWRGARDFFYQFSQVLYYFIKSQRISGGGMLSEWVSWNVF